MCATNPKDRPNRHHHVGAPEKDPLSAAARNIIDAIKARSNPDDHRFTTLEYAQAAHDDLEDWLDTAEEAGA